jgi:Flp pilus assembly protein TadG
MGLLRRLRHPGLRGFNDEERAQALVEFALVLPVFLLLVTGIFDAGRAVWQENTLAYAAREGTRYAIVHGASGNPIVGPCSSCVNPVTANLANVTNAVTTNAVGVYGINVTIDYPDGGNNRNQRVTVDATAAFTPLPSQYLLGGAFTLTLRGGSQLVIQR